MSRGPFAEDADPADVKEPTHLGKRDRIALAFRVVGTLVGFAVVITAFATSSWSRPWVIAFVLVTAGGAISYHLVTSIVRCPSCSGTVSNFRIASADAKRKLFSCRLCGTKAWLREGFYWQSEF